MAIAPIHTGTATSPLSPHAAVGDSHAPRAARAPVDRARAIWYVARVAILFLAALRAWDARHDVSPDGIAYLDLSDAVLQGRWVGLVSTYWSPLYPLLIGLARLALAWTPLGTPANEFALVHVVNFGLFGVSFVAFEWLVVEATKSAAGWGNHALVTTWGRVAAYVLFGALTLAMSPPSLTTPDLLVNAACFAAFASILRLERRTTPPDACLLGASLGLGVLAKSFMLPFSVLVLGLLALRYRFRGARVLAFATVAWLIFTAPWVAAMTHSTGHFTLGDTGRLNYIWFVDGQEPPNGPELPAATMVETTGQLVPGLSLMREANGTNPLWLDPARWYPALRPHWDAARQLAVLRHSLQYYLTLFSPLLLAGALRIALADVKRLRTAWRRAWPIVLPCAAGLLAYALVYSVARYLVPFATAAALLVALTVEPLVPTRSAGFRTALAVALVLTCEWLWGATRHFLVLPLAMSAALPVYVVLLPRRRALSIVAAIVVALLVAAAADQCPASWYPFLIFAVGLGTWLSMRHAVIVAGHAKAARALRNAVIAAALCALVIRVGRDTRGAITALRESPSRGDNSSWMIARDLAAHGLGPGSSVAVIASPYDAGWARLGRLHLVGAIPPARASRYWSLDEPTQRAASKLFADAGAVALIAVPAPDTLPRGWARINGGAVLLISRASAQ
jgi:hypothetical protein